MESASSRAAPSPARGRAARSGGRAIEAPDTALFGSESVQIAGFSPRWSLDICAGFWSKNSPPWQRGNSEFVVGKIPKQGALWKVPILWKPAKDAGFHRILEKPR